MTITCTIRIIGLATSVALAACSSHETPKTVNIVTETVTHSVQFRDDKVQLPESEYDSLDAFMQTVRTSAVSYAGIATDDSDPRSIRRAQGIKAYLVKQGVDPEAVHVLPTASGKGKNMLLTLEYAKALPPKGCPDYSESAVYGYSNPVNFSNFGCAYDNDIAMQMADPADYEGAHAQPAVDATRDSVVIQKYRTAAPATLSTVSASSPASSSSAPASTSTSVSSTGAIGSQ